MSNLGFVSVGHADVSDQLGKIPVMIKFNSEAEGIYSLEG
jgi:hypothetical protein